MFSSSLKQCLSFFLALIMLFLLLPVSVFATETEQNSEPLIQPMAEENNNTDTDDGTTPTSISVTESQQTDEPDTQEPGIQERIDAILVQYGITAEMTDNDIANAINAMDGDTLKATMDEMAAIEEDALSMTEEELAQLDTDLYGRFCDVLERLFSATPVTEVTVLDGQVSVTDTANSNTVSNGMVTIKAAGSLWSKKTNNVTITNKSSSTATLSFDYSASKYSSFKVDNATANASGSYSGVLNAGASVTLVLVSNSGFSNTTATLTLSNFKLTAADTTYQVSVSHTEGTVTVGEAKVENGSGTFNIKASGTTLQATGDFVAWVDATSNKILSTDNPYELFPQSDMSIKAIITSDACFISKSNSDILYEDLNTAIEAGGTTIILYNNGTLPAGDYTIPSGITLLIPYNDANTLCTTAPTVNDSSLVAPTAYRTLTMESNANITVNGGLSVAGTQAAVYPINGQVTGPVGVIKMNEGSNITVSDGGSLYAWGYVAGSGTVTIKNNGKVYEDFQVRDYRGGDVTSTLANSNGNNVKTWHIFPMSQYYVQNVQVPMTLEAGATEFCYFSVTASLMGIKSEIINFIGTDSMFQITSGYIVKDYDEKTDRLTIDVYGNLEVNPFSIEIQVKGFSAAITINSANYDLPLNSNITINMNESSIIDLNQDLLLLPGSEINIGENTKLNINNGKRLIVYDDAQWGLYCSDLKAAVVPLANVYNGTKGAKPAYTRTTADLVDAKILVNGTLNAAGGYLYTTEGGGNISSSGAGQVVIQETPNANAYQIEQKRNGDDDFDSSKELDTHPITSAQLKNSDETYVATTTYGAGTYTYDSTDGKWHKYGEGKITAPTCTEQGYTTYTCEICGSTKVGDYKDALGHNWSGGVCGKCGELSSFAVAQVQMVNSLTMQFGYPKKYLSDPTGFYVLIERTSANDQTTKTTQKITSDLWNADSDYYIINFNGLAAKEMCDTLTLTMYNANNEPVSKPWIDSMRDYAMRVLSKATEQTQKTLAVDFLNYGAEAQKQFDYCKTDLANAKLTEEQKKFASDTPTFNSKLDGGDKRVGSNLILENNILFVVAFRGLNRDMSATVTFKHHNGQDVAVEIPGSEFGTSGNVYYVPIDEIVVADARQPITITVKNADGSVYTTCQDSIEDYLARYTSTISDINTAVMKFADSAYAYLHRNDNT